MYNVLIFNSIIIWLHLSVWSLDSAAELWRIRHLAAHDWITGSETKWRLDWGLAQSTGSVSDLRYWSAAAKHRVSGVTAAQIFRPWAHEIEDNLTRMIARASTWQRGGGVFDVLCKCHRLDTSEATPKSHKPHQASKMRGMWHYLLGCRPKFLHDELNSRQTVRGLNVFVKVHNFGWRKLLAAQMINNNTSQPIRNMWCSCHCIWLWCPKSKVHKYQFTFISLWSTWYKRAGCVCQKQPFLCVQTLLRGKLQTLCFEWTVQCRCLKET